MENNLLLVGCGFSQPQQQWITNNRQIYHDFVVNWNHFVKKIFNFHYCNTTSQIKQDG